MRCNLCLYYVIPMLKLTMRSQTKTLLKNSDIQEAVEQLGSESVQYKVKEYIIYIYYTFLRTIYL